METVPVKCSECSANLTDSEIDADNRDLGYGFRKLCRSCAESMRAARARNKPADFSELLHQNTGVQIVTYIAIVASLISLVFVFGMNK
jgi:hypothetical protein